MYKEKYILLIYVHIYKNQNLILKEHIVYLKNTDNEQQQNVLLKLLAFTF